MRSPAIPADEPQRLADIASLALRDTGDDPVYAAIAKLAAAICDVPIALIGLVDADRQWFLYRLGLDAQPTPREQTFCAHAIVQRDIMEVPDATRDARFSGNPFVLGDPFIRFYAGVPIAMRDDTSAIGTLCVIDREPRTLSATQRSAMQQLGAVVTELLLQRRAAQSAERALRASEERMHAIADNTPAAICYIDRDKRYRYNNAAYARWLRRPLSDITGKLVRDVHGEAVFRNAEPHLDAALAGRAARFESAFVLAGETRHLRGEYVPHRADDGDVLGVYGLAQDVTPLKLAEDQLRHMAQYDALTGLANRYRLYQQLDDSAARARRHGTRRAVLYLDIDHFKAINDGHGHAVGDLVLCEFALRLRECVRDVDTVARLAGDEFVIVLEELHDPDDAHRVAEKIVAAIREPFMLGRETLDVSTSIGLAYAAPGDDDTDALLRRADAALYQAKAAGRGGWREAR